MSTAERYWQISIGERRLKIASIDEAISIAKATGAETEDLARKRKILSIEQKADRRHARGAQRFQSR